MNTAVVVDVVNEAENLKLSLSSFHSLYLQAT